MEPHALRRITALLDQIAGRNQGRRLVERLLETRDMPGSIAREVAGSPSFERLYKEARTVAVAPKAHTAADSALVGATSSRASASGPTVSRRSSRR